MLFRYWQPVGGGADDAWEPEDISSPATVFEPVTVFMEAGGVAVALDFAMRTLGLRAERRSTGHRTQNPQALIPTDPLLNICRAATRR
jgi:hypothetical protein